MEWTNEILELIKEAGFKNIQPIEFPEYFLTCTVGKMRDDAKINKELAEALLQYEENRNFYIECLIYKLAEKNPRIVIEIAKTHGILTDVQKIEFEEISTADRLAELMKYTDDEI